MFKSDAQFFELRGSMALAKAAGDVSDPHGRRMIEGVASTPDRDMQGEIVEPMGLDFSYFARHGRLNWDHGKGPSDIIGEPLKWTQKPEGVYLYGLLYSGIKRADEAYALLQAGATLGWSLEGKVLERDPADPTRVTKAAVINCAVTHNPVCTETWCKLTRGEVSKSLDTSAGAPVVQESLEGRILQNHANRCQSCGCMEKGSGGWTFKKGYRGALEHFSKCCEAPLGLAANLAARHTAAGVSAI